LRGHTDWVRDVAYMPSIGMPKTYLASASQDKSVIIWTQNAGQPWKKQLLKPDPFTDAVWRVSWSLSGGILAVSSGDNKITLWREGLKGEWENVNQLD
jgi:protein transport protein SEC13